MDQLDQQLRKINAKRGLFLASKAIGQPISLMALTVENDISIMTEIEATVYKVQATESPEGVNGNYSMVRFIAPDEPGRALFEIVYHSDGSTAGHKAFPGITGRGRVVVADQQSDGTVVAAWEPEDEVGKVEPEDRPVEDGSESLGDYLTTTNDDLCQCPECVAERAAEARETGARETFAVPVRNEHVAKLVGLVREVADTMATIRGRTAPYEPFDEAGDELVAAMAKVIGIIIVNQKV